ncbi:hypothetical protein [Streptomyces sp. B21-102]|uniref:hypothetical protein n=1 Tax=Streptomyces sp. B21-102 TaxID=3039416 RepID=UPI003FA6D30E
MSIVLMSDPRVAAIPVQDCGEDLVDIRVSGAFLVDERKHDPNGHYAHLRQGRSTASSTPSSSCRQGFGC